MSWKEIAVDYFTFTRKDRLGILVLLALLCLIFGLNKLTNSRKVGSVAEEELAWLNSPRVQKLIDSLKTHTFSLVRSSKPRGQGSDSGYENRASYTNRRPGEIKRPYFHQWHSSFAKKEDGRIRYGKWDDGAIRARPKPFYDRTYTFVPAAIDVNAADSSMFVALPGIGSKLAARILKFREKLGGFYSIEQVGETFGLPDSTFLLIKKYLRLRDTAIRRININIAGEDELKSHPYIRWNLSGPIITYRNEHGPYHKLEDLKNVMAVTDAIYERILPYLTIE